MSEHIAVDATPPINALLDIPSAASAQEYIAGDDAVVLHDIYRNDAHIVVWQRKLSKELALAVDNILNSKSTLRVALKVSATTAHHDINQALASIGVSAVLINDMVLLVHLFCHLFDLERASLKLTTLAQTMCPKFHTDNVACRLLTTYQGRATEWLPQHVLDRNKLGVGSQGKPDDESGLFQSAADIRHLQQGEVALLKGKLWPGNAHAGLVHRSPPMSAGERRLLFTLDFISD